MKGKLMTLFACFLMVAGMVTAQNRTVSGVVTSASDGEPVIGASVAVKGVPTLGAITDLNGRFVINNVPSTARTLVVSYVGLATKEVAIRPNVAVELEEDSEVIDEVIVQAFGTAKKSAFTGSAAVINSEKLAETQVSSVTNALAGKVAGVQIKSSNGAPGATSAIRIRGISSINAGNDPLIVVDGAPYDGDIANINPADVESMTVLKDAASNALYGARGANGVIMITTKKAKEGNATITFDGKYGTNTRALQQYNVITDPGTYYEAQYAALNNYFQGQGLSAGAAWEKANKNLFGDQGNGGLGYQVYTIPDGQFLIGQNGKLNPKATLGLYKNYKNEDYLVTPDDWSDVGYRTGVRQEYNVSVSASNERSSFFASLGYLSNEGITEGSDHERLSGRLRADYKANKWLKVGGNMSFAKFESNFLNNNGSSTSSGNIWAFTSQMAPIYPIWIRTADGNVKIDGNGLSMMDYGNGTNAGFARPFISDANPIMDNKLNTFNSEGNANTGSGFADFTILPGLVATLNGTYNLDETRTKYIYNPYYGQFDTTGGTVEVVHSRSYSYNLQQLLNYTTTLGLYNNFNFMAGHEYYRSEYYTLWGTKHQMFSPTDTELNRAVVDNAGAGSYKSMYNNEGYFGRIMYDYDNRIFASASIRRDASSRFDPQYQWGTFWSVGGAWLINKEAWMSGVNWIDELKLKASIGSQGNDNISSFMYTDRYDISNSDGNVGVAFAGKGTRDITWETNTNFNAGIEFGLFRHLTGGIEYFRRTTTDMLFAFAVAPSAGYTSYYDNIGDMYNQGVEVELNYNVFRKKNFTWDINLNATTMNNKITFLADDVKTTSFYDLEGNEYKGYSSGNMVVAEGASLYTWRLPTFAGVDQSTGESLWYKRVVEYEQDAEGKDIYYDADGNITDDTENGKRKEIGSHNETTSKYADATYYVTKKTSFPDIYGGFGTSLYVYGFDFSVNFSYQLGGWGYDSTYAQFMSCPTGSNTGYTFHKDIANAWTPENATSDVPRWQFGDTNSASTSTRFLTKSSYLNIENIAVGYTFPRKLTTKIGVDNFRVYCAADNLYYWSARKGFDPRQGYGASNATNYSPMRSVSLGVTIVPAAPKETKAPTLTPQTVYVQSEPQVVEKVVEKEVVKEVPVAGKKNAVSVDENLYFVIGQSELRAGEAFKLGQICQILKDNPDATISIAGYADKGTGTPEINNQLSAARAKVVADKLIEAGISASRISTSAAIADDRVAVCIVK